MSDQIWVVIAEYYYGATEQNTRVVAVARSLEGAKEHAHKCKEECRDVFATHGRHKTNWAPLPSTLDQRLAAYDAEYTSYDVLGPFPIIEEIVP